jgi:hypothetical protein
MSAQEPAKERVSLTPGWTPSTLLRVYLQPEQALGLIGQCAKRFPGGPLLFDLPPRWFAVWTRLGIRTSLRYKVPTMPFSLTVAQAADLVNKIPGGARSTI